VLIRAEGPSFTVGGDVAAMAGTPPAELPALLSRITAAGFAGLGLSVDSGGTWFLPRLVGTRRAAELCLSPRVLKAAEAAEWGLITRVVRDDDLTAEAETVARRLAAGPTRALGEIRTLLRRSPDAELGDQLRAESAALARTGATRDAAHGIASFMARTTPGFEGC
jgi:2-(1,2-epoxy-1,2-dihydrophenyl)acetyl-CoA isomerase